jgi:transketolase
VIHQQFPDFVIGKGITIEEGTDICILGTGTILPNVIAAAHILKESGLKIRVVSFHTVKPLDTGLLEEAFSHYPLVVTVEEHSLIGGLGSAVAEWISDQPHSRKGHHLRIGIPDEFLHYAIHQKSAQEVYALSPDKLADSIHGQYKRLHNCRVKS